MSHHKVRVHNWNNGELSWKDIWFHTLEVAKEFIEKIECDTWKIFDADDVVVDYGSGKKPCEPKKKKHHKHKKHKHHHHKHDCNDDDCDEDCDCDMFDCDDDDDDDDCYA